MWQKQEIVESGHCSSTNLLVCTLICYLPAYSLGKEEEWYALPPPARGGSLALPLSLPGFISTIIAGITIDSHSDAEEQGRFGFGLCFR